MEPNIITYTVMNGDIIILYELSFINFIFGTGRILIKVSQFQEYYFSNILNN